MKLTGIEATWLFAFGPFVTYMILSLLLLVWMDAFLRMCVSFALPLA